jgi:hypothetical protein
LKIQDFARKKLLRLPVYMWAAASAATLIGIVVGAVLFSASFNAHVNIIAIGSNLSIRDGVTGVELANSATPNINTFEFGTIGLGDTVRHYIIIQNAGQQGSVTFYIRLPGSLAANPEGPPLPDGVTVMLDFTPGTSCAYFGGSFNPEGTVCSISLSPGQAIYWDAVLTAAPTATIQDLSITIAISAFDTQF